MLGQRDRSSDGSTEDSEFRWATTARSPEGMMQTDRKPQTSGTAPPKDADPSRRDLIEMGAKLLGAVIIFRYVMKEN